MWRAYNHFTKTMHTTTTETYHRTPPLHEQDTSHTQSENDPLGIRTIRRVQNSRCNARTAARKVVGTKLQSKASDGVRRQCPVSRPLSYADTSLQESRGGRVEQEVGLHVEGHMRTGKELEVWPSPLMFAGGRRTRKRHRTAPRAVPRARRRHVSERLKATCFGFERPSST